MRWFYWISLTILLFSVFVIFSIERDGVDIRLKAASTVFNLFAKYAGMHQHPGQPIQFDRESLALLSKKIPENMETTGIKTLDIRIDSLPFKVSENNVTASHPLEARLFIPNQIENKQDPLGIILWFHGGGYALGSSSDFSADETGKAICKNNQLYVLYIDYRLAPEYKFPHGLEDCYSSLYWLAHLEDGCLFNTRDSTLCSQYPPVDLKNIIVGGDSAGGNFAIGTMLLWNHRGPEHRGEDMEDFNGIQYFHDHGLHSKSKNDVKISLLVLVYPSLMPAVPTESAKRLQDTYFISRPIRNFFVNAYLPNDDDEDWNDEEDDESRRKKSFHVPYISALSSKLLHSLPSTIVLCAEKDPLHDENRIFAALLEKNNVPVEIHSFDAPHGFFGFAFLDEATVAHEVIKSKIAFALNF